MRALNLKLLQIGRVKELGRKPLTAIPPVDLGLKITGVVVDLAVDPGLQFSDRVAHKAHAGMGEEIDKTYTSEGQHDVGKRSGASGSGRSCPRQPARHGEHIRLDC